MDENSSTLNVGQGTAIDMDNFEVDLSGAVQLRKGYTLVYDFGATGAVVGRYMTTYFTTDGTEVWVAIAGNKFWEAPAPGGPWTDRTNSVTISAVAGPWMGAELNGKFVLVNGTDAPVYHTQGASLQTLKTASLIQPPQNATMTPTGANDSSRVRYYLVTAITANGETTISNLCGGPSNLALSAASYNAITWDLRAGAQGYSVYRFGYDVAGVGTTTQPQLIATVGRLTNTFNDTGVAFRTGGPPSANTAYNTPASWDSNPPNTIGVLARGRAQRMFATQDSTFYASTLSDCLDWETGSDAFYQPIRGGTDNVIKASVGLYDYTVLFSDTNAFVFTGSTYNDFQLAKILNVGCNAPHSIVAAGDEAYFWSDLGPNSLSRVQLGQDLQTAQPMHLPVQKTVHQTSNKSAWSKIVAWKDVANLRVGWAYPVGTSTSNSKALIRGTVENGWSRHSMPAIVSAVADQIRDVYVLCEDGKVYKLDTGNNDAGAAITGYYTTGWYDSQSNLNRYIDTLNVIMDKTIGNYNMTVEVFWDFATTANSTHTLTQTSTDGIAVVDASPTANFHSCYVQGMGRYFQIKFSVTETTTRPRILGWREEMYTKGRR